MVRVENWPGLAYESPYTKVVVAASAPSGDSRARLGSPVSGRSPDGVQSAPSNCARYVLVIPRRAERHTERSTRAYTRSHDAAVSARGPSGAASGTTASRP